MFIQSTQFNNVSIGGMEIIIFNHGCSWEVSFLHIAFFAVEAGFKRVMEVAAVKNIDRMNSKAIEMGKEPRHNIDNIANKFSWVKADEKNRIILILVAEELGY